MPADIPDLRTRPTPGSGEGTGAERRRTGRTGPDCVKCEARALSLCGALREEDLTRLDRVASQAEFVAHDLLVEEGEVAIHLFNVSSGLVKLYKLLSDGRRQITGFLGKGDFIGFPFARVNAYTAEAVTPVRGCRFSRPDLVRLMGEVPGLEHRLLASIGDTLAAAQEQMMLLGRKNARERLASFLILQAARQERGGYVGERVALPMSRTDIADFLGLTTETVSRTLTQLRKDRLIDILGTEAVVLRDREQLEIIAQA